MFESRTPIITLSHYRIITLSHYHIIKLKMRFDNILDDFDFEGNQMPAWAEEGEVVAKFYTPLEAELAAARLRSEGVHCFLANTVVHSVMPNLQSVIRLHVRPNDSALAREILQEAALDATIQGKPSSSSNLSVIGAAIGVGIILAWLLVKALSM